jgi:arylsulfatase A-like enzyme
MASTQQPNILLILTDQHSLSAVGCYGQTPCQTPNLDRLAEQGVRFETAYTVCPVCSPARATVMTGVYPHTHGICSNVHNLGCSVHELADRPALLSRRLQAAGYRCAYTGKWHLGTDAEVAFGAPNQPSLPKSVGFEGQSFPGHGNGGFHYPEYKRYLQERGFEHRVTELGKRPKPVWLYGLLDGPTESTVPHFLADHTMSCMDDLSASGSPFFAWHNFWGPHGPYYVPREFYAIYENIDIPEWPNFQWPAGQINGPHQVKRHSDADELSWDDWAEAVRYYYAFATLIDHQIGRILDHIERTGLAENTVVVFTADHGETLGTHGGLTDKGWHHFEEIQRIPFIVRLPARYYGAERQPGDVLQEWVSLVDLYPTFLDLAGTDVPQANTHGRSLVPLIGGRDADWRRRIVVEFNGVNSLATSMVTAREGSLKYGWNCSNTDELYDLASDPYETTNLIADVSYATQVLHMRQVLQEWMTDTGYPGLRMYQQSRMRTNWI